MALKNHNLTLNSIYVRLGLINFILQHIGRNFIIFFLIQENCVEDKKIIQKKNPDE